MSAITESYQRKLKAILASEEKLDNGQTTTPFYENKLLANSIIKLVLENFPKNKQESIMDPFKVSQLLFADAVKEKKVPSAEQFALKIKNNQQVRSLFQNSEEIEDVSPSEVRLANLFDDFSLLEWGNISIPKSDMLKLNISIEMLAATLPSGTKSLRFFGRIATQTKPYYVVEGWSHDDTDQDTDTTPTTQEGRNGTNKYTYWVTTVTAAKPSDWIKLPSLTCTQIVQTRQMKRLLSGDLDATVITYPPFPGVEKHYLRAWIADIAGATVISPDGFYELDESDETGIQIKKAENYAMKPASDLLSPELWKHHELTPNSIGRVTKLPESTDENTDEKKEVSEEGEDEDVAVPAPLSTVLSDDWIFRTYKGNKSITVARSRQWPGAVSVVSGTRCINVYFGNGIKYSNALFQPPLPPSISDGFDICEEGVLLEQPDVIEDPALTLVSVTDEEGDQNDVNADDNAGGDDDGEDNEEHE